MARKPISKGLRFDVFNRDGFKCVYCGATPPGVLLHVDHVIPVASGGDNDIDNLVTSCQPCNLGKSAKSLDVVPKSVVEKAAEQAEREAQVVGYQRLLASIRERVEDDAQHVAGIFITQFQSAPFGRDWLMSVKRFIERLGAHECIHAMEIAIAKKPHSAVNCFKYFCGVCWSKIKQNEVGA